MQTEEKVRLSEKTLNEASVELRARGIKVHRSSDFSKEGYSIMLSIFIPFSEGYLNTQKIHELMLISEGDYEEEK